MSYRLRARVSWLTIVMLLFSQLAVAAFACDMPPRPIAAQMSDCGDREMGAAPLCEKHCNPDVQAQSPAAFVALPFVPGFIVATQQLPPSAPMASAPARSLSHETSPPIPIAYCRLRD